jgi:hypothetical protein
MAKEFNQIYAEAMALSNNSEALMDNLTKAAMAAGKLTAETKKDLEVFKDLRATTKDISTQLAEAGKRNLTSEAIALQQINDKILAQQKKLNGALEARLRVSKDETKTEEEKKKALASIDKQYQLQLENLKKLERKEAGNAQKAKDRLRKLSKELDNLNSRAAGTIFDPTVGILHSTGAELKSFDNTLEYMEKKNQQLADSFADAFSGSIDSVQSRFDTFARGGGNFLRDLASASKAAAEGNKRKAEKGESVSIFQKALGKINVLSGAMTGLGKIITGFAGVVGGLFAIFKVMQALEETIKTVNKELVDAYGATDLMYEGMEGTYEAINKARKEFTDADFANEMGETLEGARGLVASLNEMGINLRTTKGDFYGIKELTVGLKSASVALGTDFGTVATFTQQFKEELGYAVKDGELLDKMGDSFARIRDVAMQSGFSTNRFFQVIQSLSDGIGEMNFRIGETSRMFFNMSKVLGPKAAQAFTQGLMGGFKGEGIQDRFKRLILMGGSKKIMKRTANRTIKELGKQLTAGQAKLLSDSGIDLKGDLSKVTDAQLEKAMGNLRRQGGEGGRARADELMRAVRLARGGSGGLSDQALAMGELDLSGTMSAQMKQLYNIQGDKGFQGITAIGMEKLVQMTGKSLEELEQMRKIDMAMRSDFAKVKEIQTMQGSDGNRLTPEEMKKVLKEQGFDQLTVNAAGQITDLAGNVIGDDIQSYIEAQGSEMDKMKGEKVDQLSLLADVVDATLTSADMINNYLGDKIQDLNDPLEWIASKTGFGQDDRKARADARDQLKIEREKQKESITTLKSEMRKEEAVRKRAISQETDPHKIKRLQEELAIFQKTKQEEIKAKQAELSVTQERMRVVSRGKVEGDDKDEIVKKSERVAVEALTESERGRKTLVGTGRTEEMLDVIAKKEIEKGLVEEFLEGEATSSELKLKLRRDKKLRENVERKYGIRQELGEEQYSFGFDGSALKNVVQDRSQRSTLTMGKGDEEQVISNDVLTKRRNVTEKRGTGLIGAKSTFYARGERDLERVRKAQGHGFMLSGKKGDGGEYVNKDTELAEQLEKTNHAISMLDPDEPRYKNKMKKLEEQKASILAKSKALFDRDKKMNVEAILEAKKQETESSLRSYGLLGKNQSLSDGGTLDSVIANLTKRMNTITDKDSEEYKSLYAQRENIRKYYAKDMESTPGMGKPMLFPQRLLS